MENGDFRSMAENIGLFYLKEMFHLFMRESFQWIID